MLRRIDKDGNGTIEFEEFIQLMKSDPRKRAGKKQHQADQTHADDSEDELLAAFHVFDKDRNGYISAPELKAVLDGLGHEYEDAEVEEMLREVDINGDGCIDYAEFVAMLNASMPSRVPSRVSLGGGGGDGDGSRASGSKNDSGGAL
ncbi:hypothetical protein BOX15_Mlig001604g1 [Macrostomum lignano]|uniref:EF-hand domain-containing protein n=1 Tax=Macrostomum lignano TaxID=282301 RepID=A0A267FAE6_9PLAT|nr:hypothetical protein BOX15_Mlig001604g1 [Macrostomum lignano]